MKKIITLLIFLSFILTGCFNPVAVSIVEDMYEQALVEDDEELATYFNDSYLAEHPIEALADGLAEEVRNAGGITLLNIVEVTRNRLNSDIVKELDATYTDDWYYVVLDTSEGEIMTWIVLKTSSQYEIVNGELITVEEYNENVLE